MNSKRIWLFGCLLIISFYIFSLYGLPTEVPSSGHDDDLFISHALSIGRGNWLDSNYDQLTLIKGPYHSVQMWIFSIFRMPPLFGLRVFYSIVCVIFCTTCLKKLSSWLKCLALTCLLFDPLLLGTGPGWRLLREVSYIPIELIAVTAGICSIDILKSFDYNLKQVEKKYALIICLIITYFSLGLLMITREARFVVVATALYFSIHVFCRVFISTRYFNSKFLIRLLPIVIACFVSINGPVFIVKLINQSHYGLYISNEFEEGSFKSFYQNLSSVKKLGSSQKQYVPIDQESIDLIRSVANDNDLSNVLSNLDDLVWKTPGCNINQDLCGEYAGGWFMWALRQSMFSTFQIDTPEQFQDLTRKLNKQIIEVCDQNKNILSCVQSSYGYLPYPERWANDGRPFVNFLKTSVSHFQYLISPANNFAYGQITHMSKNAKELGVSLAEFSPKKLSDFADKISRLNWVGRLLRNVLITSFAFVIIRLLIIDARSILLLFEPSLAFIGILGLLTFIVLVLVHITSFPSRGYLNIVSPLITVYIWRFYDILVYRSNPSRSTAN
ncbi:putative membrane protein [Synechococcus sp. SYN20]|uniref:hypothetical protein n=1 Tax=Synechococcus sp. SYN20 TaxID=1050714 RepID=UPI0016459BD2|nr:hypothetical protein [Synechococcus sp. SYN20]QNJ24531.1 putative membrane protein [Synechococcus sp. SYN20]